jgi:hypothetical protein
MAEVLIQIYLMVVLFMTSSNSFWRWKGFHLLIGEKKDVHISILNGERIAENCSFL